MTSKERIEELAAQRALLAQVEEEGRKARRDGYGGDVCPYSVRSNAVLRKAWELGWDKEHSVQLAATMHAKWGADESEGDADE